MALARQVAERLLGGLAVGAVVHRHSIAALRKSTCDRATDPARSSGNQRGLPVVALSINHLRSVVAPTGWGAQTVHHPNPTPLTVSRPQGVHWLLSV
nr:hypothetical protein GCM10025699_17450 [Microbacterium flavescens]